MSEEQLDEYTATQMKEIVAKMDEIQMSYDTRLVAALFSGRGAYLYGVLINGGVMTQEAARQVWESAGEVIDNPPQNEVKIARFNKQKGSLIDEGSVN